MTNSMSNTHPLLAVAFTLFLSNKLINPTLCMSFFVPMVLKSILSMLTLIKKCLIMACTPYMSHGAI